MKPSAGAGVQLRLFTGWSDRREVPSGSRPDVTYTVAVNHRGEFGCNCPGWVYRFPRRPCRHIREVFHDA